MRRPKVVVVTPYSPFLRHHHAAADLAFPFLRALGEQTLLHIIAPDNFAGGSVDMDGVKVWFHGVGTSTGQLSRRFRFGRYPYSLRSEWRKEFTKRAVEIVRAIGPDVVHAEYLQPAEVLTYFDDACTSITLHDMSTGVFDRLRSEFNGVRRLAAEWEYFRIRAVETKVVAESDHVFVFSERDAGLLPPRPATHVVSIGIETTALPPWRPSRKNRMVFSGAMWRRPNELSAISLARDVLPRVQREFPSAHLIVAGANPSPEVVSLGEMPGVFVTGAVDDLESLVATADVVMATSEVPAGVLLKALKGMGAGIPTILNDHSAAALRGLKPGVDAIVANGPAELASEVARLFRDPSAAELIGRQGAQYVYENFNWKRCVGQYLDAWFG